MTDFQPTSRTGTNAIDDVGVVILSYGPTDPAGEVIEDLCRDGRFSVRHVVEVHNPSKPGEQAPGCAGQSVLNLPENVGYAGGMNAGIRELAGRYPYVALLTHDVRMSTDTLIKLRSALAGNPDLGIVGPVLTAEGEIWSAGKRRTPDWAFRHLPEVHLSEPITRVDSLDGSVLMLRAVTLDAIEFDPRFFMYFEETDFIERLRRAGLGHAAVVSAARAESIPGGAVERPFSHAYLMARNGSWVAFRHGGLISAVRYATAQLRDAAKEILARTPEEDSPSEGRIVATRRLLAKCSGIIDSLKRRSGPPPLRLRDGDLRD